MKDEQILREVYNRLREGKDLIGGYAVLADFIEQEWQKEDERIELVNEFFENAYVTGQQQILGDKTNER